MLSYVPVNRPMIARHMMKEFFTQSHLLGPSAVPYAATIWIIGGNIKASPDEHNAPINEMKEFNAGTTSDKETAKIMNIKKINFWCSWLCRAHCLFWMNLVLTGKKHQECSK